jgi:hypothetical protein
VGFFAVTGRTPATGVSSPLAAAARERKKGRESEKGKGRGGAGEASKATAVTVAVAGAAPAAGELGLLSRQRADRERESGALGFSPDRCGSF